MNILDTNIEKLKQDQLKALQEQMKKVFDDIYDLFEKGKYQEIADKYVKYSPAGDCMGCDNDYINFSWNDKVKDIGDVLEIARSLTGEYK
ncbi:MAG: hypothetical protein II453_14620 [Alphaproteobacteria bacterium]|nr:hypothetical protein [Alphaproteobacteria bacterium]